MQVKSKPNKKEEPAKPRRGALLENAKRAFRDIRSELRKVTWPTREQTTRLTIVVGAVSIAMGIFLGAVDYLWEVLFRFVIGGF